MQQELKEKLLKYSKRDTYSPIYKIKRASVFHNDIQGPSKKSQPKNSDSTLQYNNKNVELKLRMKMLSSETPIFRSNYEAPEKNQKDKVNIYALGDDDKVAQIGAEFRDSNSSLNRSFWKFSNINNESPKRSKKLYNRSFFHPKAPTKISYSIRNNLQVPDIMNKETIISLAKMASNAYEVEYNLQWEYIDNNWKIKKFGWNSDGLRGYVYTSLNKDLAVVAFKGTDVGFIKNSTQSLQQKDKLNNNLLFSCCCANSTAIKKPACGCYSGKNQCNLSCIKESLKSKDSYAVAAANIVKNVLKVYPKSKVILTGHSLGGSIASLMGLNFGLPAVTFAAPGDLLAAKRLNLPIPSASEFSKLPIYHVGLNSDPVFLGTCGKKKGLCSLAGYKLESQCRVGNECVFDTQKHLKLNPSLVHHMIYPALRFVFERWVTDISNTTMPTCKPNFNCKDCDGWEFV
ncbi:hypothetical protein BB561_001773 [Smittium simulii]|uniref:triacylglycerol lipase n=1 Tax=Smittium simulii TaxID=133385 RepID=A0A2T9YTC2_9FUNG|nr:hypothetical protein BB561_001773 [Smittium simulii]